MTLIPRYLIGLNGLPASGGTFRLPHGAIYFRFRQHAEGFNGHGYFTSGLVDIAVREAACSVQQNHAKLNKGLKSYEYRQHVKATGTLAENAIQHPMTMAAVNIYEVGPRDGLQNIHTSIPADVKIELIKRLQHVGLHRIELTSAVNPRAVPQLRDCQQVMSSPVVQKLLQSQSQLRLPVLVPNIKGLGVAVEHGIREIAVFVSATEEFSKANINCSVAEGLQRAKKTAFAAKSHGLSVRGYVSCIFTDPYTGPTAPNLVYDTVKALVDMGCYQISLGDTLGVGTPSHVRKLLDYLFSQGIKPDMLAGHFHDTYGQALANVWEAYQLGIRTFDTSVGGLGGCPFAPGAQGNVATEDVAYLFQQAGIETGIDLDGLVKIGSWISQYLKKDNNSRAGSAIASKSHAKKAPKLNMKWSEVQRMHHVLVFKAGANGKIVLNEPKKGNTLSLPLVAELRQAFLDLEADDNIARIVITAKGKYFCTGMDLSEGDGPFGGDSEAKFNSLLELFDLIDKSSKVTIACINGPAFGGGIGLAFSCDLRISVESASFTLSEVKLGLCPAIISKYVVREWGVPRTRKAMLTARPIPASELHTSGAIHTMAHTLSDLESELDGLLHQLRRSSPGGSRMSKELVRVGWASPNTATQQISIATLFKAMMQPDAESVFGVSEFRKKRVADWDARSSAVKAKL
ncbi:hypothetical protein FSARC_8273 [Fusarium sarcochroum]|uniref:hydroxymethylglutaryl-CoA lyase n=1 Tax=Fusarium sarcochroum TaxID=1208366 RepID=A0A8H4X739_9HYPO|nr:hypothetical protein FSARC_8273 [Fusarium sarcochroum]